MRWWMLCAWLLALAVAGCGSAPPPEPVVVEKIVYVRLDVEPERTTPLPIPPPPERGATLAKVKDAAAACYAALRSANADRAHLARLIADQNKPK